MSVARLHKPVSLEEFLDGIEDEDRYERCEYWDGEIVPKDPEPADPMSPIRLHAYIQIQLGRRLANYLGENPLGTVLSEIHTYFRSARRVFLPDGNMADRSGRKARVDPRAWRKGARVWIRRLPRQ